MSRINDYLLIFNLILPSTEKLQILRRLKLSVVVFMLALLSGCAGMAYYAQAVNGHMDVLRRSQPINAMIVDPGVDPDCVTRPEIRDIDPHLFSFQVFNDVHISS